MILIHICARPYRIELQCSRKELHRRSLYPNQSSIMKITEVLEAYDKAKAQMKSSCVLIVWTDELFEQFKTAMGWPSEKVNSAYIFWTPVFHCHDWNQVPLDILQKYDLLTIVKKDEVVMFDKKKWLEEYNKNLNDRMMGIRNWPIWEGEPGWRKSTIL